MQRGYGYSRNYHPRGQAFRGYESSRYPPSDYYRRPQLDSNVEEYIPSYGPTYTNQQSSFQRTMHLNSEQLTAVELANAETRFQTNNKANGKISTKKDFKFVHAIHLPVEVFEGNILKNLGIEESEIKVYRPFPEQKRLELLYKNYLEAQLAVTHLRARLRPKLGTMDVEISLLLESEFEQKSKHRHIVENDQLEESERCVI